VTRRRYARTAATKPGKPRRIGLVWLPALVERYTAADSSATQDDGLVFSLQRIQPGAFTTYENRVFEMLAELGRTRSTP
jgi:hypothetical protein